ncbi:MAG TPA: NBR1-Ig-like domain-containing protein [Anaerolineaceae bacterium]
MKSSLWDILSIFVILGIIIVVIGFVILFTVPSVLPAFLRPPEIPQIIAIPTSTSTPRSLPPTWTPTLPVEVSTPTTNPNLPTSTVPPTNTPFTLPTAPPTWTSIPPTPTATATRTPSPYQCKLLSQSPSNGTIIPPNNDFDAVWSVQNSGSLTWDSSNVDLKYISGTKFQERTDTVDLDENIEPGYSKKFIVDMRAPGSNGTYNTTWGLVRNGVTICAFTMQIVVK